MKRPALIAIAVASFASFNVHAQTPTPAAQAAPTFAKDVAPIMYGKSAN